MPSTQWQLLMPANAMAVVDSIYTMAVAVAVFSMVDVDAQRCVLRRVGVI